MRILALLAVVALATAMMAPVIAEGQRTKPGAQSCGIAKKLDPRTKSCVWRH